MINIKKSFRNYITQQQNAYQPNQVPIVEFHWRYKQLWEKTDNVKTASLCNKRKATNANAQNLGKAQSELTHTKKNKKNTLKVISIKQESLLKIENNE